jgi:DUF4097 and DUF4098 domain-containing protein YvlB
MMRRSITQNQASAEECTPDRTEKDEEDERTITLHLSKEAGITSEELRKKIGYYMKFSYDADEIYAVADSESDDDDDISETVPWYRISFPRYRRNSSVVIDSYDLV